MIKTETQCHDKLIEMLPKDNWKDYLMFNEIQVVAYYLFYRIKQYDIWGHDYLVTNGKYFMVDSDLPENAVGGVMS